jgi:hypothetical protein
MAKLVRGPYPSIVLSEVFEGVGDVLFAHACKLGCEGIVSKRLGSLYRSGRSPHWVKVKNPKAPALKREVEEDWGRQEGRGAFFWYPPTRNENAEHGVVALGRNGNLQFLAIAVQSSASVGGAGLFIVTAPVSRTLARHLLSAYE